MGGPGLIQRITTTPVANVNMAVANITPTGLQVGLDNGTVQQTVGMGNNIVPLSVLQASQPADLLASVDQESFKTDVSSVGLAGKTVVGLKLKTDTDGLAALQALQPDQKAAVEALTKQKVDAIVANPRVVADTQILGEILEEDKGGVPSLKLGEL